MKTRRASIAAALGLLLTALVAPARGATSSYTVKVTGPSFHAFFRSTDETGCIITYVGIFGGERTLHRAGEPRQVLPEAAVTLQQYDGCQGRNLWEAWGYTSAYELKLDPRLSTATLDVTIPVQDLSGAPHELDVALTWTGTGPLQKVHDEPTHCNQTPDFIMRSYYKGTFRAARAVGRVALGTTNFTPEPSGSGSLARLRQGWHLLLFEPDADWDC